MASSFLGGSNLLNDPGLGWGPDVCGAAELKHETNVDWLATTIPPFTPRLSVIITISPWEISR